MVDGAVVRVRSHASIAANPSLGPASRTPFGRKGSSARSHVSWLDRSGCMAKTIQGSILRHRSVVAAISYNCKVNGQPEFVLGTTSLAGSAESAAAIFMRITSSRGRISQNCDSMWTTELRFV
jgi:hypothetical protein